MFIVGLLVALLLLNLIVVAHEFGHFFTARLAGVRAYEFGVGLPPRLFGIWSGRVEIFADSYLVPILPEVGAEVTIAIRKEADGRLVALHIKKGRTPPTESYGGDDMVVGKIFTCDGSKLVVADTLWAFNLLPLGGYVAMLGEKTLKLKTGFASRPAWTKLVILGAGIAINLALPLLLLPISNLLPQQIEEGQLVVREVVTDSPAYEIGLMPDDRLISLDSKELTSRVVLRDAIRNSAGSAPLRYERDGVTQDVNVDFGGGSLLGVGVEVKNATFVGYREPIGTALGNGFRDYANLFPALYGFFAALFTDASAVEVLGPVGVGDLTGGLISQSPDFVNTLRTLIRLAALLSFSIGIFNLVPIPPLDGGKMAFITAESLTRRSIPPAVERAVSIFGVLLLLGLTFWVFTNDIANVLG